MAKCRTGTPLPTAAYVVQMSGKAQDFTGGHRHKDAQDKREPVADSWNPKGRDGESCCQDS